MSEMNHTPEPWVADFDCYPIMIGSASEKWPLINDGEVTGETGAFVANVGDNKANARRIVACVNACTDITTDELEWIASIGGMLGPREDVVRIARQRYELQRAIDRLSRYFASSNDVPVRQATIKAEDFRRIITEAGADQ